MYFNNAATPPRLLFTLVKCPQEPRRQDLRKLTGTKLYLLSLVISFIIFLIR